MWSAKPGMQVVCLNSVWYWPPYYRGNATPVANCIYTIRTVATGIDWQGKVGIGLRLEEIRNPLVPISGTEPQFLASFFRPCAPTDISALRALLAPKPARSRKVEVVE